MSYRPRYRPLFLGLLFCATMLSAAVGGIIAIVTTVPHGGLVAACTGGLGSGLFLVVWGDRPLRTGRPAGPDTEQRLAAFCLPDPVDEDVRAAADRGRAEAP